MTNQLFFLENANVQCNLIKMPNKKCFCTTWINLKKSQQYNVPFSVLIKGTPWRFLINKVLLTFSVSHQKVLCVLQRSNKSVACIILSQKNSARLMLLKNQILICCSLAFSLLCPCNLLAQCYFSWHIIITHNQWNSVKPLAGMYIV